MIMKTRFDAPSLYADHHVIEVRRVLLEMPGITEIYASSCFRVIEVSFDPQKIDEETIKNHLATTGYLDPLPVSDETGGYQHGPESQASAFRQTRNDDTVDRAVSFKQEVPPASRAGWPCPGMGLLKPQ